MAQIPVAVQVGAAIGTAVAGPVGTGVGAVVGATVGVIAAVGAVTYAVLNDKQKQIKEAQEKAKAAQKRQHMAKLNLLKKQKQNAAQRQKAKQQKEQHQKKIAEYEKAKKQLQEKEKIIAEYEKKSQISSILSSSGYQWKMSIYTCPITFELINQIGALPCGHIFEKEELEKQFQKDPRCSLCREEFKKTDIRNSFPLQQELNYFKKKLEKRKTTMKD